MIAKHIPMRVVKKSSFRGLVEYMRDPQSKQERVGQVAVTNCHQDNPLDAAWEVQATQALNTTAATDKTYHLIISFAPNETPDADVLKAIEARVCEALGYGEHQRVSAVHHDTDNLHIHVAINKIHPARHTSHTPFFDYKILGAVCDKLEVEYGLVRVNHKAKKTGSENRADDMERHAGVESLMGWIKRECSDQLRQAQSWSELHAVLHSHGLELQPRGAGFVITNGEGVAVKASSVARDLSMGKLEQRLGAFVEPVNRPAPADAPPRAKKPPVAKVGQKPPPRSQGRTPPLGAVGTLPMEQGRRYEGRPTYARKIDTTLLYAQYKNEQQHMGAVRAERLAALRGRKVARIEAAKQAGKRRRIAIKLARGAGVNKRLLYALASKSLQADIAAINADYQREKRSAYEAHRRMAWADWLKQEAGKGSTDALAALRAREARAARAGNAVGGKSTNPAGTGPVPGIKPDNITKAGTVIYRVGATTIRDTGERLNVTRGDSQEGLEAAIRLAAQRYGSHLSVAGSEAFKERIAQAAARAHLNVTFDDPALERRRQELTATTTTTKEQTSHDRRSETDTGRGHRSGDGHAARSGTAGRQRAGRAGQRSGGHSKPDVGRVGTQPPPAAKNRLRGLSQLGVVQLAHGGEVLLPRDVPGHVEQQGTQRTDGVRRPIHRAGGISGPAARYVQERESKRALGFDIEKHRGYNERDSGPVAYRGLRNVEGVPLALLKRENEIIVLPVDPATARRLKRLAVGTNIELTDKGTVQTARGRSR